nr:hypothetical protein Iba_chr11aCG13270 [Ipomoea batatas]
MVIPPGLTAYEMFLAHRLQRHSFIARIERQQTVVLGARINGSITPLAWVYKYYTSFAAEEIGFDDIEGCEEREDNGSAVDEWGTHCTSQRLRAGRKDRTFSAWLRVERFDGVVIWEPLTSEVPPWACSLRLELGHALASHILAALGVASLSVR